MYFLDNEEDGQSFWSVSSTVASESYELRQWADTDVSNPDISAPSLQVIEHSTSLQSSLTAHSSQAWINPDVDDSRDERDQAFTGAPVHDRQDEEPTRLEITHTKRSSVSKKKFKDLLPKYAFKVKTRELKRKFLQWFRSQKVRKSENKLDRKIQAINDEIAEYDVLCAIYEHGAFVNGVDTQLQIPRSEMPGIIAEQEEEIKRLEDEMHALEIKIFGRVLQEDERSWHSFDEDRQLETVYPECRLCLLAMDAPPEQAL